MSKKSPLSNAQADSLSVCGKLLRKGQSMTVASSAIGRREQRLLDRKLLSERPSNKAGHVQLVCLKTG